MDEKLLQKLKDWRGAVAQNEGVELFRVLPNKTLEGIAAVKPATREELLVVKGVRDKKFEKYGKDILALVNGNQEKIGPVLGSEISEDTGKSEKPYTVSSYLNLLNSKLEEQGARIQGEIGNLNIRESYLFFSLKDKDDESILNCFMWESNYRLCGVSLEEGMELIVEGFPEVYKPTGRLTFKASIVELIGEGALKKAYDQLKKKLESEGLFAVERKRPIPKFPQKIGLITSKAGDAIHDFTTNLEQVGFEINFFDCRVEGQQAVSDLINTINWFSKNSDAEVLIIIRGGGSWESLQAFNNEAVGRAFADSKIPILCGIGHEKDIPIVSLVADKSVSTPTATAEFLSYSWREARKDYLLLENRLISTFREIHREAFDKLLKAKDQIIGRFGVILENKRSGLTYTVEKIKSVFHSICNKLPEFIKRLKNSFSAVLSSIENRKEALKKCADLLGRNLNYSLDYTKKRLINCEKRLYDKSPERQLKLGYSLVFSDNKVVKNTDGLKIGQILKTKFHKGLIKSAIKKITK